MICFTLFLLLVDRGERGGRRGGELGLRQPGGEVAVGDGHRAVLVAQGQGPRAAKDAEGRRAAF